MVKVTAQIRSKVIEKHLYGYSFSQIGREVGISKTMSYNIVQDWNSRISFLDIDDIRIFLSHLRKSDITIEQCVKGYRSIQLLQQLGVVDDSALEEWASEEEEIERGQLSENHIAGTQDNKETSTDSKLSYPMNPYHKSPKENQNSLKSTYQFNYFVQEIYNNCKYRKIKPYIIIRWIEDLFNFYSNIDYEPIDDNVYNSSNTDQKNSNVVESQSVRQNEEYDSEVPFISTVSNFIKVKKKNINYLQVKKNSIAKEIAVLEKQKTESVSELDKVIEKEKKAYSYFNWYNTISQYLFNKYEILLEQEIDLFARAFQDFKQYNYSATKILSEYKIINSLRNEIKRIRDEIQSNSLKKDNILKKITSLEDRSNYYQQTIKIYEELNKEGLGLSELKRLNYLVMESAYANGLEVRDAIKNFLKDVEDNYDNKLGFEKKISELKSEMKKLEQQVPEYQFYLKLQGIVSPTLIHLHNSGVTNEDIIEMNHLVLEFKDGNFLSDPINKNYNNLIPDTNSNVVKNHYWKVFVDKLKELKNINLQIQKQSEILINLKREISRIEENKQNIDKAYVNAVAILNNVLTKLDQYNALNKLINEKIEDKIIKPIPVVFPVFIKYNSSANKKLDNKKDNDHDKDK